MTSAELIIKLKSPHPEDLFGDEATEKSVSSEYGTLAKLVHPDTAKDIDLKVAAEAFDKLTRCKELAVLKLQAGTYGDRTVLPKPINVGTKKVQYVLTHKLATTDTANLFRGTESKTGQPIILKVVKSPNDNDLLKSERELLKDIRSNPKTDSLNTLQHLPKIVDSFIYVDGNKHRETIVFEDYPKEGLTLTQLKQDYFSDGVPLEHLAWMFNRLLGSLEGPHLLGYVHGAIIPANFVIFPSTHNGILTNWEYAVKTGETVKALAAFKDYRMFYPEEITTKKPVSTGTDLFMAAKLFIYMSGGSIHINNFPDKWAPHGITPNQLKGYKNIQGLMKACLLGPITRSNDVGNFYTEFREALKQIFGPPKWRDLVLPKK